jgi:hypothetical protein
VPTLEPFARVNLRAVLERFGVAGARRALTTDATEEVILLADKEYRVVDHDALTLALMEVLPDTKVWVIPDGPGWSSELI